MRRLQNVTENALSIRAPVLARGIPGATTNGLAWFRDAHWQDLSSALRFHPEFCERAHATKDAAGRSHRKEAAIPPSSISLLPMLRQYWQCSPIQEEFRQKYRLFFPA